MSTMPSNLNRLPRGAQIVPPPLPARPRMVLPRAIAVPPAVLPVRRRNATNKIVIIAVAAGAAALLLLLTVVVATRPSVDRPANNVAAATSLASPSTVVGSDGFQTSHRIYTEIERAYFEVTIKGKLASLAVILTGPSGDPVVEKVESDDMITGSARVIFCFSDNRFPPGNYFLEVKKRDSGIVVCHQQFLLSAGKIEVKDVKPQFSKKGGFFYGGPPGMKELVSFKLTLIKTGDLPVYLRNCTGSFVDGDGTSKSFEAIVYDWIADKEATFNARLTSSGCTDRGTWKPGARCKLSGQVNSVAENTYDASVEHTPFDREVIVR